MTGFDHTQAAINTHGSLYKERPNAQPNAHYAFTGVDSALMHLYCYMVEGCTRAAMMDPDALMRKHYAPHRGTGQRPGKAISAADSLLHVRDALERAASHYQQVGTLDGPRRAFLTLVRFGFVDRGQSGISDDAATELANARFGAVHMRKDINAMVYTIRRDVRERLEDCGMIERGGLGVADIGGYDLKTWKDIASALDTTQATARNWHAVMPMPVKYAGKTVCAKSEQLKEWYDRWLDHCSNPGEAP